MGDQENLIQELRALIISSKGGITFRDLRRDYLEIGGSESTFKKLGFKTIESFVEANPNEFSVNKLGLISASVKDESKHIQRLVNQQSGKTRSRIDFKRPSLRPASRYNASANRSNFRNPPISRNPPINRNAPSNRGLGQPDLREFLNERHKIKPLMGPFINSRQVQEDENNVIKIRREWPQQLFTTKSEEKNSLKREIPPRFRPKEKIEESKINANQEAPKQLPIFQYKAKSPVAREPYRHNKMPEVSSDEDYDDDEELFKDVPALDDTQIVKTPIVLNEPQKIKTVAEKLPIAPTSLPLKNPAANRLARLGAKAQMESSLSTNGWTQLSEFRNQLDELSRVKGISSPEIKVMSHIHGVEKLYTCLVKVGENVFSSDYGSDPSKAEMSALRKAFNALNSEPDPKINDATINLFLTRLQEILKTSTNGLWMSRIPELYKSKHGEEVPDGWENETKRTFEVSPTLGQFIVYPRKKESLATPEAPTVTLPTHNQLPNVHFPLTSNERRLPSLITPEDRYWDLYVLMCHSPLEVFARIIGPTYSDKLDELLSLLEVEMMTEKKPVSFPIVGEIYAVCAGGASRGRLETILPNKMGRVYFIDEGNSEELSLDKLFYLDNKYFDIPAQAFKIALKGLETFPVTSHFNLISPLMARRICVCEIMETYPVPINGVVASTILWDTTTDNDINLNRKIMEDTVTALIDPSLSHEYPRDMIISHVGDNLYLRTADKGIDCISSLIDFILSLSNNPQPVSKINFKEVYLALDPMSNMFQRAVVREFFEDKCVVFFIDFGASCEISISNLFHVETICRPLTKAAPQAIKVTLAGVGRLQSTHVKYLNSLVDSRESILVTIVRIDNAVPCVSLHRRIANNSSIQNVNINIILKAAENGKEILMPMALPPATLPAVKSFFSVRITLAVSPSNFMVQYDESINLVNDLMEELQQCNLDSAAILQSDDIECDMAYAVKYTDDWYRAEVTHDMGNGDIGIKLCDFGNTAVVPVKSLRQLPDKFFQYPKLAVRANLADIVPVNRDWCPADCVFFQEAVMDRDLAGILKAIIYDDYEPVLELKLIDTSGDDDIDITKCLVESGIANHS